MAEHQALARPGVRRQPGLPDLLVGFVRGQDGEHVGAPGGVLKGDDLEPVGLGLGARRRALAQRHQNARHPAVAQIERMGAAMIAIADQRHGAPRDRLQIDVGVV